MYESQVNVLKILMKVFSGGYIIILTCVLMRLGNIRDVWRGGGLISE